jgi:hypothetical protein
MGRRVLTTNTKKDPGLCDYLFGTISDATVTDTETGDVQKSTGFDEEMAIRIANKELDMRKK